MVAGYNNKKRKNSDTYLFIVILVNKIQEGKQRTRKYTIGKKVAHLKNVRIVLLALLLQGVLFCCRGWTPLYSQYVVRKYRRNASVVALFIVL